MPRCREPGFADGLLEVVGFNSGYQAGAVMAGATSAVRLAQTRGARVRISGPANPKKSVTNVFLQLDGEPWQQDAPRGGSDELVVRPCSRCYSLQFHLVVGAAGHVLAVQPYERQSGGLQMPARHPVTWP